jgi:hypothetical protein
MNRHPDQRLVKPLLKTSLQFSELEQEFGVLGLTLRDQRIDHHKDAAVWLGLARLGVCPDAMEYGRTRAAVSDASERIVQRREKPVEELIVRGQC